jgi:hypothetical protein
MSRFLVTGCFPFGLALALLAAGPTGCSTKKPDYPQASVSGEVTLDGEPLPDGKIIFTTVRLGLNDVVPIRNGQFSSRVALGERQVMITATKMMDPPPTGMPGVIETEKVPTETLPARYNAETTLTATVSADGPNEFMFELTSDDKSDSSAKKKEVSRPR